MAASPVDDTPVDPFTATPPPETEAVRSGEDLDWAAIEQFLRAELPPELTSDGTFRVSPVSERRSEPDIPDRVRRPRTCAAAAPVRNHSAGGA